MALAPDIADLKTPYRDPRNAFGGSLQSSLLPTGVRRTGNSYSQDPGAAPDISAPAPATPPVQTPPVANASAFAPGGTLPAGVSRTGNSFSQVPGAVPDVAALPSPSAPIAPAAAVAAPTPNASLTASSMAPGSALPAGVARTGNSFSQTAVPSNASPKPLPVGVAPNQTAGAGRGTQGAPTALQLDTAPGSASDLARKASYGTNRVTGGAFDVAAPQSVTGQLQGVQQPEQQVIQGPAWAGQTAQAPAVANVGPRVATPAPSAPIQNIMPPQPSGLVPTDSQNGIARVGNSFSDISAPAQTGPGVSTIPGQSVADIERNGAGDIGVIKARAALANVNDRPAGIGGFVDSATAERNAGLADSRTQYLIKQALDHGGRQGPAQAAALAQAGATQAGEREAGVVAKTAGAKNLADISIARNTDSTHRYVADSTNATAQRGQNFQSNEKADANRNALDVANIRGNATVKAADLAGDGRVAAADARANKFMHVAGGQETMDVGGMPTLVKKPDRIWDNTTGKFVGEQAAVPAAPASPPPPKAGDVIKGHRYKGGDASNPNSWEKV
jgi:hypothetical protein